MITVHMVFHAHLDPIWLWPWQAGLDEALATSRTACDLLDANPDAVFTQGEAWAHHVVEQVDPGLFTRIREHIVAGRWALAGGWWIQPDCNSISGIGLERQIRCGREYLLSRFGRFPEVAFNVDSFGHAATLPGYLNAAGQNSYVMMRPQEHEMSLPGRLFRWRGYADGPELLTFRIAGSYNACPLTEDHVRLSLTDLPEGVSHTMGFAGVGDHGGGPTQALIDWVRMHERAFDGMRLVFSSPSRFFAEIADARECLPLVTGELQHHAIGCYTVHRAVKLACRRAECRLLQAEHALELDPCPPTGTGKALENAWRSVCLHQFHDTMGGTCIPSAYERVADQLGGAAALAEGTVHFALRRRLGDLPDCADQRIVLFNPAESPFEDFVEFEPWMGRRAWSDTLALLDEQDRCVPYQTIRLEALVERGWPGRILFAVRIPPGGLRVLRLVENSSLEPAPVPAPTLCLDLSASVMGAGERTCPLPRLHLLQDPTDTWSHGVDRYAEDPVAEAVWDQPERTEHGPLMTEWARPGRIGSSDLLACWRVYPGIPFVELRLRVDWNEKNKVLKLVQPVDRLRPKTRTDGIPGGVLQRHCNGRELPLRDWTLLDNADGQSLGILCPRVFALDATPARIRLTILRSPRMAHHDPCPGGERRVRYSDRGEHDLRFRFYLGNATAGGLDATAAMLKFPPVVADLTRGMPKVT